jgi:hypothetical protein
MKKSFLKREWKFLLLIILLFTTAIYAPEGTLDLLGALVFIVYTTIIYKFFGGYDGEYNSEKTTKEKILKFITIPKIIIFIIFLLLLDLYSNDARVIAYLLDLYVCRGLEEGLPSVASGCYDIPKDN